MNDVCPDCGRQKAHNVEDVSKGYCPKWWAIRDAEAEEDCKRFASQQANEPDQANHGPKLTPGDYSGGCLPPGSQKF